MTSQPDPSHADRASSTSATPPDTHLIRASDSANANGSSNPPAETSNGQTAALTPGDTPTADAQQHSDTRPSVPNRQLVSFMQRSGESSAPVILVLAIAILILGFVLDSFWIGIVGSLLALFVSLRLLWSGLRQALNELLSPEQRLSILSMIACAFALVSLLHFSGLGQAIGAWYSQLNWDAVGATGEVVGAVGQILIAVLAVYVAWRQYVISKDLTIQQNLITQQQTIDSYFQGISDLVLDAEGLLEDWPQERAIAEGRTAAILSSIDATGKAKVIRFLSRSRLLSPLKRDRHLGRAILDGMGGYQEDRDFGIRVIDLGVMLAASNLASTDLRWTDLSDINLIRANLANCDLVKTNLARTILCDANLAGSDMMGARLFYGSVAKASPRSRTEIPNYKTGEYTGAVIEGANFRGVKRLSEEQRQYCCSWGGFKTRGTIPGGCEGIPNLLEK